MKICRKLYLRPAYSELIGLALGSGSLCVRLLFLLWSLDDVFVSAVVVDHSVELFHGVDLVPAHVHVAYLAHLFQELVELLARVSENIHSVD